MIKVINSSFSGWWLYMALAACLGFASNATAGTYRDSAHGNAVYGVDRSAIDARLGSYATGNCAHCHEMHASMGGFEPSPAGGAAAHALFAPGFSNKTNNPYQVVDNVCFYCHSDYYDDPTRVFNQNYSSVFGGGNTALGPQTIFEAFNENSYHNLNDINDFMNQSGNPYQSWFAGLTNPCSACHDPHRAQRNWSPAQPGSAISLPGQTQLWFGTMMDYSPGLYVAPYYNRQAQTREPFGTGDPDGNDAVDYVTFCTSCHTATNPVWSDEHRRYMSNIYSSDLNRHLSQVDWQHDKHGMAPRDSDIGHDGTVTLRGPFSTAGKSNIVLHCLNCHEPHGTQNIALLRTHINGEQVPGTLSSFDQMEMGLVCGRCHIDDANRPANVSLRGRAPDKENRWEYIHHAAPDAPYAYLQCRHCHDGSPNEDPDYTAMDCIMCHGHGKTDAWAPRQQTGRVTF